MGKAYPKTFQRPIDLGGSSDAWDILVGPLLKQSANSKYENA